MAKPAASIEETVLTAPVAKLERAKVAAQWSRAHLYFYQKSEAVDAVIRPMVVALTDDGETHLMPVFDSERDAGAPNVRAYLADHKNINRIVVVGEAWMKANVSMAEARKYKIGDLAKSPDKIEVVTTMVEDRDGGTFSRVDQLIRGETGRVRELKHLDLGGQALQALSGNLANLFSDDVHGVGEIKGNG